MQGDADSANVVGEIIGRDFPHEIVVVSGHFDSWDVGTGAIDDGGGCVVSVGSGTVAEDAGAESTAHGAGRALHQRGERAAWRPGLP